MSPRDGLNQSPSASKTELAGRPREFWWLIWLVLFLVAFNLVLFGKFVLGSRSGAGAAAGESTTNGAAVTNR